MPVKKDPSKITMKEEIFCQAIVDGLNNLEAYYKAGYTKNNSQNDRKKAWVIKNKPNVKARIEELLKMVEDETIMSRREVLQKLTLMASGITTEENIVADKDGNYTIVPTKVKGKEQAKALELLGKFYKLYTEKQEIGGTVGVNITFEDDLDEADEVDE